MTNSDRSSGGLRWVLLATAVAGALGYLVQLIAPGLLGQSAYVAFSVTWSTIYLSVSAMSGVQQEVARAARASTDHAPNTVLRRFTIGACVVVLLVSVILGFWLSTGIVPAPSADLASVIGIGLVGYLLTAVLSGVLYGLHRWRAVALITVLDAVLRALLLGIGFLMHLPAIWLAAGIAFPFGLAFLGSWIILRRRVVGRFALDVDIGSLSRNVVSTVGSAVCSGAMISGLPLLLGITSSTESADVLGAVILAITLSRAPIVVPVVALQSYLISAVFRDREAVQPRRLLGLLVAGFGIMSALAGAAYFVGPPLVLLVSNARFVIDAWLIAIIVFSAGLVAMMCVTGPALVAARRHDANVAGWAVAAGLTIVCLLLPVGFASRVALALTLPAALGLLMHVLVLLRSQTISPIVRH